MNATFAHARPPCSLAGRRSPSWPRAGGRRRRPRTRAAARRATGSSQYASARTLGLGGAFVAVRRRAARRRSGIRPGSRAMDQNEAALRDRPPLRGHRRINGFSFAVPGSRLPSFGLSDRLAALRRVRADERAERRRSAPSTTGETAYLLTASKAFTPRLALGANVKLVAADGRGLQRRWRRRRPGRRSPSVTRELRIGASVLEPGRPEPHAARRRGDLSDRVRARLLAAGSSSGRGLLAAELDQSSGPGPRCTPAASTGCSRPRAARRLRRQRRRGRLQLPLRAAVPVRLRRRRPPARPHAPGRPRATASAASSRARRPSPQVFSPTGEQAVTKISLNARTKADPAALDARPRQQVGRSRAPLRRQGPAAGAHRVGRQGRDRPAAAGRQLSLPARRRRREGRASTRPSTPSRSRPAARRARCPVLPVQ